MWNSSGVPGSTAPSGASIGRSAPILGLGIYFNSSPWRLGPAWAVLAGALASQAPIWGGENLLRLGGSILLADALWGVFWQQTAPRRRVLPERARSVNLPYSGTHSPMMDALSGLRYEATEDDEIGCQGILAALGLAAVLGLLLGFPAIVLSLLALIASVGVRLMVRLGRKPALAIAILVIGLPWALGASLAWTGAAQLPTEALTTGLLLSVAFTMLAWSVYSVSLSGSRRQVWSIWVGQVVVLVALMIVGDSLALAVVGGLFVVPCFWLSRNADSAHEVTDALRNSGPWWLASMLGAALTVRP